MTRDREGDFELYTLRSGVRALRHVGHGEVMHPAGGPWEEARRLYAEQLRVWERARARRSEPLRILDVGLGGATNAIAVLTAAQGGSRPVELHSLEVDLSPLRLAARADESFPFLRPWLPAIEGLLSHGEWRSGPLHWRLSLGDARATIASVPEGQELVLFDPFSPKANPELWTPSFLGSVRERCADDALLATYSAATPTRVSLLLAGFFVGSGAPTGSKGETTLASPRMELLEKPLGPRWLERWRRSDARAPHGQTFDASIERRVLEHPQFAAIVS